jgi:hypothetical protein
MQTRTRMLQERNRTFSRMQKRNGCTTWGICEAVGEIVNMEENIGSCIQLQDPRISHLATQDEAESLTVSSSPPPTDLQAAKLQLRRARRVSTQGHRPFRSLKAMQTWHRHLKRARGLLTMPFLNRYDAPPSWERSRSRSRQVSHAT